MRALHAFALAALVTAITPGVATSQWSSARTNLGGHEVDRDAYGKADHAKDPYSRDAYGMTHHAKDAYGRDAYEIGRAHV